MNVVRSLRSLVIAIWLGAAIFFSFVIAPTVFAVLPARELAGAVVSRSLSIINAAGFIIGLVLLVTVFLFRKSASKLAFFLEVASLVILALSTFIGKWIIATRMQALRAQMQRPIDDVAPLDPLRVAFNSLHGYSVTALSIAMLSGFVVFFLIARRFGTIEGDV